MNIVIIKNQIMVIKVFLDLILFLYSQINNSINEKREIINNIINQIFWYNVNVKFCNSKIEVSKSKGIIISLSNKNKYIQ